MRVFFVTCLILMSLQLRAQQAIQYGFIHLEDSTQDIPPEYTDAQHFSQGLAAVKKEEKWGFITPDNQQRIRMQYDGVRNYKGTYSLVRQGDQYGVIDQQGNPVIPIIYLDLMPYILNGKTYYISRDMTFYTGMLDANGKEVFPHQYAYIMPLIGLLGKENLYPNIPFYTVYQDIDTSKGSFYEQFKENPLKFSPSTGRHTIYDTQFNALASRMVQNTQDEFSDLELYHIDRYLEQHPHQPPAKKKQAIHQLLDSGSTLTPRANRTYPNFPSTPSELKVIMQDMGYQIFTEPGGKKGVKLEDKIILPASFDIIRWWGSLIEAPQEAAVSYLKTHFAGRYRAGENRLFEFFGIAAGDKQGGILYNMQGEEVFDLGFNTMPESPTVLGFSYRKMQQDTVGKRNIALYGLNNWKGKEILPPEYARIEVMQQRYILTSREKPVQDGTESRIALQSASGKAIIPEGVFSELEAIPQSPGLYLAQWDEQYPTVEERQQVDYAYRNKTFVLLELTGDTYRVLRQFKGNKAEPGHYDPRTKLLKYSVKVSTRERE